MTVSERALEFVSDGDTVGLGTGRAAAAFVRALGKRVAGGLRVRGVPTSVATETLARGLGIPLVRLDEVDRIDTTFDGADEVAPNADLIKGYGGALVREKVVAGASQRLVVLVGVEKLVERLGERGKLPVEVLPFAETHCARSLEQLGCAGSRRSANGTAFVTDNGNHILDCRVSPIDDPAGLDRAIREIPGVVGTGLFVGMADIVLIQDGDTTREIERS